MEINSGTNKNDCRTRFFDWVAIGIIISAVVVDVVFVLSILNWWAPLNGALLA